MNTYFVGLSFRSPLVTLLLALCLSFPALARADVKFGPLTQQKCSIKDAELMSKVSDFYSKSIKNLNYDRSIYFEETNLNPLKLTSMEFQSLSDNLICRSLAILLRYSGAATAMSS
jgi:hypothetical protein